MLIASSLAVPALTRRYSSPPARAQLAAGLTLLAVGLLRMFLGPRILDAIKRHPRDLLGSVEHFRTPHFRTSHGKRVLAHEFEVPNATGVRIGPVFVGSPAVAVAVAVARAAAWVRSRRQEALCLPRGQLLGQPDDLIACSPDGTVGGDAEVEHLKARGYRAICPALS